MILVETLTFVFGAGIRCWIRLAEVYGRKGYRCVERWLKMYNFYTNTAVAGCCQYCRRILLSWVHYRVIWKYVRMLEIWISMYYSEADGWARKRFEVKSRESTDLFLQDVRVGQMQIAFIFESSDTDIKLVTVPHEVIQNPWWCFLKLAGS